MNALVGLVGVCADLLRIAVGCMHQEGRVGAPITCPVLGSDDSGARLDAARLSGVRVRQGVASRLTLDFFGQGAFVRLCLEDELVLARHVAGRSRVACMSKRCGRCASAFDAGKTEPEP